MTSGAQPLLVGLALYHDRLGRVRARTVDGLAAGGAAGGRPRRARPTIGGMRASYASHALQARGLSPVRRRLVGLGAGPALGASNTVVELTGFLRSTTVRS
jgi:hypothetical protein